MLAYRLIITSELTHLRAVIEEQYAKKLAGLAKMAVGRDEVG